ncbi:hypothetical protein CDAR_268261 [Caerostris darwini]|uniref:Uncharacterized protein n=1 Tax=Caerostris darwini TaxID=1538125 RepID=A0AAV4TSH6_9ARAC|nr:hypothetical protein CDAR_268261 [Caerostris darwini]
MKPVVPKARGVSQLAIRVFTRFRMSLEEVTLTISRTKVIVVPVECHDEKHFCSISWTDFHSEEHLTSSHVDSSRVGVECDTRVLHGS